MIAEIKQPLFLVAAAIVDDPERALRELRAGLAIDRADPGVLDPNRGAAAASLGKEAITQAVAQLGPRRDMRTAGDPVIARAGMLRIDEQRKGASLADLLGIGDAEHGVRVRRPIDAVVGELPAIGGLADRREDIFKLERSAVSRVIATLAEAEQASGAVRTRRRLGIHLGELLRGCTQLTAPIASVGALWRLACWRTPYPTTLKKGESQPAISRARLCAAHGNDAARDVLR